MQSRTSVVVITALISIIATSLVWLLAIGIVYWYVSDEPPFVVKVDAPHEVLAGETITIKIQVINPTDEPLKLGSIDIYDGLLKGFSNVQCDPKPDDSDHTLDFTSFYFSKTLNANETLAVSVSMKAIQPGVWTGDIDFCTPMEKFVTSSLTIRVKESGEAAAAAPANSP
jgi:hypothetical protein